MVKSSDIFSGTVTGIKGSKAAIKLSEKPGCDGCAIASACGSRPSGSIVIAFIPEGVSLGINDRVKVKCPPLSPLSSMKWGLVYPCILLITITVALHIAGVGSSTAAGLSLGGVAVYYLLLLLLRLILKNRFKWQIVS